MWVCVQVHVCVCVRMYTSAHVYNPTVLLHNVQTLMVQVWYPMTVCTNSRAQKEIIAKVCANVISRSMCMHGSHCYAGRYVHVSRCLYSTTFHE